MEPPSCTSRYGEKKSNHVADMPGFLFRRIVTCPYLSCGGRVHNDNDVARAEMFKDKLCRYKRHPADLEV